MLIDNYKAVLSKYADFSGRARRSEYWYFVLGNMIIGMIVGIVSGVLGAVSESLGLVGSLLVGIFQLAILVPSLAVAVRRLHDTGRSGWWLLLYFTVIGILVILVFLCLDSEAGTNKWGPNPKTGGIADVSSHLVD